MGLEWPVKFVNEKRSFEQGYFLGLEIEANRHVTLRLFRGGLNIRKNLIKKTS